MGIDKYQKHKKNKQTKNRTSLDPMDKSKNVFIGSEQDFFRSNG